MRGLRSIPALTDDLDRRELLEVLSETEAANRRVATTAPADVANAFSVVAARQEALVRFLADRATDGPETIADGTAAFDAANADEWPTLSDSNQRVLEFGSKVCGIRYGAP